MIPPGTRIGNLLIGELLGRGGMGEVYRGEQISLRRPVAIKRIAEHLVDNPDVVRRFEREAQCVARIQSPHVVAVHEFGQYRDDAGATHFLLVMELVEGALSLGKLVAKPMPWPLATRIVMQAAEGLVAAAEQGVVHRDIKPDNIMLSRRGVAKLTDFGLARAVDSTAMTLGGTIMGTPAYMPPEVCRGEVADARGDLYSLGATWFHLVSGRPPFTQKTTLAVLRAHVEEAPPDVGTLAPDVPPAVAALIARCLAKSPDDRPASAKALLDELERLAAADPSLAKAAVEVAALAERSCPAPLAPTIATDVAMSKELNPRRAGATVPTLLAGAPADPSAPTVAMAPTAQTVVQPSSAPPRRHGGMNGVIAVVALAIAGGAWWFTSRSSPPSGAGTAVVLPVTTTKPVTGPVVPMVPAAPPPVPAIKPPVPESLAPTPVVVTPPPVVTGPPPVSPAPPVPTPTPVVETAPPAAVVTPPPEPAKPAPVAIRPPDEAVSDAGLVRSLDEAVADGRWAAAAAMMKRLNGRPAATTALATARTRLAEAEQAWDGSLGEADQRLAEQDWTRAQAALAKLPATAGMTPDYAARRDQLAAGLRSQASAAFDDAVERAQAAADGGDAKKARSILGFARATAQACDRLEDYERTLRVINAKARRPDR